MPDNVAQKLFALFTSSDRAEAMAGDLAEERERLGWVWFWLHAVRITFALWLSAAVEAPLRVLALAVAGCALFTAPALGGAASVGLFPHLIGSPVNWITLSFFWWGGAFWTGASMVAISPRHGMAACATLAVAAETLLIAHGVTTLWRNMLTTAPLFYLFYVTGLVVAALLLAGGAVAHRRMIASGLTTSEHRG